MGLSTSSLCLPILGRKREISSAEYMAQSPCTLTPHVEGGCLVMKGPGSVSWHVELNPSAAGHGEASGAVHTYALESLR